MSIHLPTRSLLIGGVALLLVACAPKPPHEEPMRAVRVITVGQAQPTHGVKYTAEVRARIESRLGFRVGGKLLERTVDPGSTVQAGQVMARLDAQDLQWAQDAARAALQAAQTQFDVAHADWQRYKALHEQGFIGAAELEHRTANVRAAQAQLDQARAQAAVQGNQTAYAVLKADRAGVVTAVMAEPGQVVAAGAPVIQLAYEGPRDVVFAVPEDRVVDIKPLMGRAGGLRVRLGDEQIFLEASLREIAAAADPVTRTFLAKADLGGARAQLGQTATVSLPAPSGSPVLKLPLTAVVKGPRGASVWVLDPANMSVQVRPVVLGATDGNEVLVQQGLKVGESVVTAGTHVLNPGQKVRRYVEAASGASAAVQ